MKNERDDFWDISKLAPNAKKPQPRFKTEQATVSYEVPGDAKPEQNRITVLGQSMESEESTYVPLSNPLISKITVRRIKGGYDFYESFRKAALLYYDVAAAPAPFVSFYSYMPQYSQMNAEQKSYYFYLRSEIRKGNYSLRADLSYLYLYIYEILNLPEKILPKEGISLLCRLWKAYRKSLPAIDRYLSVWVQDYCVVHRLDAPTAELEEFIYDIIDVTAFKEFYLCGVYSKSAGEITALLSCLSDYDWRTGRYAGGEHRDMYKKHIEGAMLPVLRSLWEQGSIFAAQSAKERLVRDAFPCSLCTHSVKCRIEIEYYPLGRSDAIRARVTSALKYVENCLRAALSVKSRLSVKSLHSEDKEMIDQYFSALFQAVNKQRRLEQREEYESLYDAPHKELSFSGADAIEKSSWENTWRLLDTEETDAPCTPQAEIAASDAPIAPENEPTAAESGADIAKYLEAVLLCKKDACRDALLAADIPEELMVEKINELFYSIVEDIVLELCDDGAKLIEEYREEVTQWLKTQK